VERPGYRIIRPSAFGRVQVKDYVALLLIGGRAPDFAAQPKVIRITREFSSARKMDLLPSATASRY